MFSSTQSKHSVGVVVGEEDGVADGAPDGDIVDGADVGDVVVGSNVWHESVPIHVRFNVIILSQLQNILYEHEFDPKHSRS